MNDRILEIKINQQLQDRFNIKRYESSENIVGRNLSCNIQRAVLYVNTYNRMQLVFYSSSGMTHACSIKRKNLLRLVNEILTQA